MSGGLPDQVAEQKHPERPPRTSSTGRSVVEGKVVALFRGIATDAGVTVETRIFPVDAEPGEGHHWQRRSRSRRSTRHRTSSTIRSSRCIPRLAPRTEPKAPSNPRR